MTRKVITKKIKVTLPKTYWIVMKLENWHKFNLQPVGYKLPFPVQFVPPNNGEIGFLPVFDTKENALKYFPDEQHLFQVQEVPKKE